MELVDLRLAAGLAPKEHFTQQKQISVVAKGDEFVLAGLGSSRFEIYDTLARIYGLYATLSGDAKLAEFNFILNWPGLTAGEKQALYSKHACHELNFFLLKKDPEFFEKIVQPYLANKKDKTFLDDWLLANELGDYLQPWDYAQLNTTERILLSQRIARDRQHAIQDVRDRVALLPPNTDRRNLLFLTALKGRALDTSGPVSGLRFGWAVGTVKEREPLGRISGGAGFRPTGEIVVQTPILVSQNFFRHDDRYRTVNNERLDKFVTEEFLVHTVYGCQVVITNPTSSPQKLDVLLQIPLGAMPVLNGQETRSVHLDLQPYNTQTVEHYFYFPAAGNYPHYPVHVAKNERLLAHAEPVSLTVVEKLSRIDRDSWPYISQNGSSEDVLTYLRENNLHATDLNKIAFRMGNKPFFLKVVELLSERHAYNHTLWSYGIKHDVVPAVRQYLQHSDAFVQQCGASIDSPLLTINPVARQTYQQLDYSPLVNARVHKLGRNREIMNERLHGQYHNLLRILSYHRSLSDDERLAITYYLLLQDRVEEAIAFFDEVNAADLETSLQYDYFAAYLNLYRQDVDAARQIARRHVKHPVDRWRNAFVSIDRQIDEIDSGNSDVIDEKNRDQRQGELASTDPSFDLKVEAKKVRIEYQNLKQATVNYYLMDIELLFSRNPFVQGHSNQFAQILPNLTDTIRLAADQRSVEFPLPDELQNRNVLVEVVSAGQSKSQAYFSNSLSAQVIENYGHLRVTAKETGQPLATVYVKAYARMKDGSVRFYKDGYTDLRGRFDYSSLNTNELDFVANFALLVLSDEHGAIVREAVPPKR